MGDFQVSASLCAPPAAVRMLEVDTSICTLRGYQELLFMLLSESSF